MFCVYNLARYIHGAALSFVNGDEEETLPIEGTVDEGERHNPFTASLGCSHWSWRLTCGVCLEYFQDPIILPCGHTFCRRCLTTLVDHERRRRPGISVDNLRFRCPECRHSIRVQTFRNRLVVNRTAALVLEAWLQDLKAQTQMNKGVQTSTRNKSRSTQTSPGMIRKSESLQLTATLKEAISSLHSTVDILQDVESARLAIDRSPRGTSDCPVTRHSFSSVESTSTILLDEIPSPLATSTPTGGPQADIPLATLTDQWGCFTDASSNTGQSLWLSAESLVSRYGWYFNHFLFAFLLAVRCSNTRFSLRINPEIALRWVSLSLFR